MTDNQLAGYFSYLDKLNRMAITNMRRATAHLIKLTETREITPYVWVHPDGER
jgi:hypothetical protein